MGSEDLKYIIGADSSRYERAMERVRSTTETAGKYIKVGFAAAGAAVGALSAAFAVAAKESLTFGDQVHKANLRLGVSTEALSQLKHAADLSGVSFETLQTGLRYMERQLSEVAAKGQGPAKNALDALGLSIEQLRGLKPETQFEIIAEQLNKVADSTDKAAIAAQVFGGRGVELVQMASAGAEGIRAMREEADSLGLTLSQDGANAIANFNDAMTKMKGEFTGTTQQLVVVLAPFLTDFIKWFGEYLPDAINITIKAYNWLSQVTVDAFKLGVEAAEEFYNLLGKLPGRLGAPYREAAAAIADTRKELESFKAVQVDLIEAKGAGKVFGEGFDLSTLGGVKDPGEVERDKRHAVELEKAAENEKKLLEIEQRKQENLLRLRREGEIAGWQAKEDALRDYIEQSNREIEIERQKEETKVAIQKAAAATAMDNTKKALAEFGKSNALAFKLWQGVEIAHAVATTAKNAVIAFGQGMAAGGPYAGPALAAAYAAAAIAFGAAQISAILSASPGGAGSPAGTTSISPVPVTATGGTGGTTTGLDPAYARQEEKKPSLTVNIQGDFVGDETFIDRLAEKLNMAIEDRNVVLNAG